MLSDSDEDRKPVMWDATSSDTSEDDPEEQVPEPRGGRGGRGAGIPWTTVIKKHKQSRKDKASEAARLLGLSGEGVIPAVDVDVKHSKQISTSAITGLTDAIMDKYGDSEGSALVAEVLSDMGTEVPSLRKKSKATSIYRKQARHVDSEALQQEESEMRMKSLRNTWNTGVAIVKVEVQQPLEHISGHNVTVRATDSGTVLVTAGLQISCSYAMVADSEKMVVKIKGQQIARLLSSCDTMILDTANLIRACRWTAEDFKIIDRFCEVAGVKLLATYYPLLSTLDTSIEYIMCSSHDDIALLCTSKLTRGVIITQDRMKEFSQNWHYCKTHSNLLLRDGDSCVNRNCTLIPLDMAMVRQCNIVSTGHNVYKDVGTEWHITISDPTTSLLGRPFTRMVKCVASVIGSQPYQEIGMQPLNARREGVIEIVKLKRTGTNACVCTLNIGCKSITAKNEAQLSAILSVLSSLGKDDAALVYASLQAGIEDVQGQLVWTKSASNKVELDIILPVDTSEGSSGVTVGGVPVRQTKPAVLLSGVRRVGFRPSNRKGKLAIVTDGHTKKHGIGILIHGDKFDLIRLGHNLKRKIDVGLVTLQQATDKPVLYYDLMCSADRAAKELQAYGDITQVTQAMQRSIEQRAVAMPVTFSSEFSKTAYAIACSTLMLHVSGKNVTQEILDMWKGSIFADLVNLTTAVDIEVQFTERLSLGQVSTLIVDSAALSMNKECIRISLFDGKAVVVDGSENKLGKTLVNGFALAVAKNTSSVMCQLSRVIKAKLAGAKCQPLDLYGYYDITKYYPPALGPVNMLWSTQFTTVGINVLLHGNKVYCFLSNAISPTVVYQLCNVLKSSDHFVNLGIAEDLSDVLFDMQMGVAYSFGEALSSAVGVSLTQMQADCWMDNMVFINEMCAIAVALNCCIGCDAITVLLELYLLAVAPTATPIAALKLGATIYEKMETSSGHVRIDTADNVRNWMELVYFNKKVVTRVENAEQQKRDESVKITMAQYRSWAIRAKGKARCQLVHDLLMGFSGKGTQYCRKVFAILCMMFPEIGNVRTLEEHLMCCAGHKNKNVGQIHAGMLPAIAAKMCVDCVYDTEAWWNEESIWDAQFSLGSQPDQIIVDTRDAKFAVNVVAGTDKTILLHMNKMTKVSSVYDSQTPYSALLQITREDDLTRRMSTSVTMAASACDYNAEIKVTVRNTNEAINEIIRAIGKYESLILICSDILCTDLKTASIKMPERTVHYLSRRIYCSDAILVRAVANIYQKLRLTRLVSDNDKPGAGEVKRKRIMRSLSGTGERLVGGQKVIEEEPVLPKGDAKVVTKRRVIRSVSAKSLISRKKKAPQPADVPVAAVVQGTNKQRIILAVLGGIMIFIFALATAQSGNMLIGATVSLGAACGAILLLKFRHFWSRNNARAPVDNR